jgi:hypothetical protein
LLLGLFLLLLLHIFLRILKQEKFLLGLHLAADVAAIKCSIPLLLILLGVESQVDVEPFLILLDGEDDEDVGLCVVVHVLDLVHLDRPHAC